MDCLRLDPPPNAHPLSPSIPLDLLSLFRPTPNSSPTRITLHLVLGQPFKQRMLLQFLDHPLVERKNVGTGVEKAVYG